MDPQPWPEGPYKSGSALPSVRPRVFLESVRWFFLKLCMVLRAPCGNAHERARFFGKKPFFRRIYSLALSGNGVEWNYLWPFNIFQKPRLWEKSGSQVTAKNAEVNGSFWTQLYSVPSKLCIHCKFFFLNFVYWKGPRGTWKSYCFSKKGSLGANEPFMFLYCSTLYFYLCSSLVL